MRLINAVMEILKRLLAMGKQGNERIVIVSDDLKNAGVLLSLDEYEALTEMHRELASESQVDIPLPNIKTSPETPREHKVVPPMSVSQPEIPPEPPKEIPKIHRDDQEIPIKVTIRTPQILSQKPVQTQINSKIPLKYEEEERFFMEPLP